jgi:hypothetical protein
MSEPAAVLPLSAHARDQQRLAMIDQINASTTQVNLLTAATDSLLAFRAKSSWRDRLRWLVTGR